MHAAKAWAVPAELALGVLARVWIPCHEYQRNGTRPNDTVTLITSFIFGYGAQAQLVLQLYCLGATGSTRPVLRPPPSCSLAPLQLDLALLDKRQHLLAEAVDGEPDNLQRTTAFEHKGYGGPHVEAVPCCYKI